MKYHIIIYLLVIGLLMVACSDAAKLLPKNNGTWRLSRETQELYLGEGLVADLDTQNAAIITFRDPGIAIRVDSSGEYQYGWTYDNKNERITMEGYEVRFAVQGVVFERRDIAFNILESTKDRQLWLYEEAFTTFNPFTRDSTTARILVQWELDSQD